MPARDVVSAPETCLRFVVESPWGLTPFVGRDRELQILSDRFAQVKAGRGQAIFVMGEPGIGKSRLFFEFRRQLGDVDATWLEGHCLSFGQTIAFHPLIDLLKRHFQIEEHDAEGTVREKLTRGVLRLGQDLQSLLPYLSYLLAVEPRDPAVRIMDPQLRRGEIFDALRRLVLRAAEVRPQILVFENLHWIDKATETFLSRLVDSIPTSRVLCLSSYRPGYVHPLGDRTYYTRIALTTLSTADSVRMAQAMLATASLPKELEALLVQKAEGTPFFVEEILKSLRDVGILQWAGHCYVLAKPLDEIFVPDTIQDVLMARIDRLKGAPKRMLQIASVIGREFTRRLLDRIEGHQERSETCLQTLKSGELIYEKSLYPEVIYVFKHSLTRDVAYHSLPLQRQRELHRRIGRAVEELYADRLTEQYEVLAYHNRVHRLMKDPATSDRMRWRYSTHLFASWGEFWLARGRLGRAREALTLAKTIGNPTQCWQTYLALGQLYTETKQAKEARRAYDAAREVIDAIIANLRDPGLRASLEHAPLSQEVYRLSASS